MAPEPLEWWRIAAPLAVFALLGLVCRLRPAPLLQVVWRACLALVAYGMLQDQISVRLCPEYFTVGHRPIAGLRDPTLLGMAWGFLGGMPGGIVLGLPLALACRLGPRPPWPAAALRQPLLLLLLAMAAGTLVAGASAWHNAEIVNIAIGQPWAAAIPPARQRWFFVVASAHLGTYLSAGLWGAGMGGWLLARRWQQTAITT